MSINAWEVHWVALHQSEANRQIARAVVFVFSSSRSLCGWSPAAVAWPLPAAVVLICWPRTPESATTCVALAVVYA